MADKDFLERMLSILPEEFQDIYDDTIPEAKEIRKKMGKKVSSVKSYSCAMPMFEDIRKLNYKGQAKVCKTFHQYIKKNPNVVSSSYGTLIPSARQSAPSSQTLPVSWTRWHLLSIPNRRKR